MREKMSFRKNKVEELVRQPLGLYVHIPFCVKKCAYCGFCSAPAEESIRERYVEALCEELKANAMLAPDYLVETIYFGGGTPSVLSVRQLERILQTILEVFPVRGFEKQEEPKKKKKDRKHEVTEITAPMSPEERTRKVLQGELAEITIEVNPGTTDEKSLKELYELGFNRISIGLQSANDDELTMLSRIHTAEEFEIVFHAARLAGFRNISADLMSGLPLQTKEKLTRSIDFLTRLSPEHVSVYSLQIEEGTPFFERFSEAGPDRAMLPDEDTDRELYELTDQLLSEHGFARYEISNYAKEGFESRHNSAYWTGTDYLGVGVSASSFLGNARFHNTDSLEVYFQSIGDLPALRMDIERLTPKERMEEFMFLGLRLCKGIEKSEFKRRFGKDIETIYGDVIKKLTAQGVLSQQDGRLFLTKRGMDVSNTVFVEFLRD